MNSSSHGDTIHETVGAYALGLLTSAECDAFEAHLADCDRCGEELEQLMAIAEVMPTVPEPAAVSVSPVAVSQAPAVVASAERGDVPSTSDSTSPAVSAKPGRTRRLFALAAGFVLLAVGALGGVVGQEWASDEPSRSPNTAAQGLGPGERLVAVDPTTGLEATAALTTKGWGTNVVLQLSKLRGPLTCTLVAVKRDGASEVAMTWAVPPKGYGTPEQPNPLLLSGGSSIARDQLDRFEVRDATGRVLVTLPA